MRERQTLVVNGASWHARLYRWWQRTNPRLSGSRIPGKKSGYRENLCHYWRVIAIWAPLRAFLFAHPGDVEFVTPATVSVVLAALGGLTTALILAPGDTLAVILGVLAGVVIVGGLVALMYYVENHPRTVTVPGAAIWRAIGRPCRAIGRGAIWFATHDFGRELKRTVYPWTITIAVLVLLAISLFPIPTLLAIAALFAAIGVGLIAYGLYVHLEENFIPLERKPKPDKGPGFVKVTGRYLVAKKHGVCPFIDIES